MACHGQPFAPHVLRLFHHPLLIPQIIQVSRVKGEVVFVSSSVMHTNGVQFEVPRQTSMSFGAPALIFEREQVKENPLM